METQAKTGIRLGSEWRYARRLWEDLGLNQRPVILIPCEVDNPDDPATGAGECRAASLISVCCGASGVKNLIIVYAHELLGDTIEVDRSEEAQIEILRRELGGADVILLGSALTNVVTEIAIKLLSKTESLQFSCEKSANGENHVLKYGGKSFPTEYVSTGINSPHTMTRDYGVFLIRRNCFNQASQRLGRLFIFCGAHTYGTQAAAELLFSPEGAFQIAERFGKQKGEAQQTWRYSLTGLIMVTPIEDVEGHSAMELSLINRERTITVLEPPILHGVKITNPLMSPTLDKFYDFANWGRWRWLGFEGLGLTMAFLLVSGLYLHKWSVAVSGVLFYIISRIVHRRDE